MKHWKCFFERLLDDGDEIFTYFITDNGAEWQSLLSKDDIPKEDHLAFYEGGVRYTDIVEVKIPEKFEHGSIKFENDIEKCFNSVRFIKGLTVKTLVSNVGSAKGTYLSVTSSI
jgi:hypothetical protein